MSDLTLVTGPSRGGKSRWGEHLALSSGRPVLYMATAAVRQEDEEWQARLKLHRQRRPGHWITTEVGAQLGEALLAVEPDQLVLIDSLGTWLAHHLELETSAWELQVQQLLQALDLCLSPQVLVCEETGWGVVPATAIGGRFRDRLGQLEQRLMNRCTAAWLVLHGRALDLLALSQPVPEA